jgi:hypothetical protein
MKIHLRVLGIVMLDFTCPMEFVLKLLAQLINTKLLTANAINAVNQVVAIGNTKALAMPLRMRNVLTAVLVQLENTPPLARQICIQISIVLHARINMIPINVKYPIILFQYTLVMVLIMTVLGNVLTHTIGLEIPANRALLHHAVRECTVRSVQTRQMAFVFDAPTYLTMQLSYPLASHTMWTIAAGHAMIGFT